MVDLKHLIITVSTRYGWFSVNCHL